MMEISPNTHRNFKSLFPISFPDAETINRYVERALKQQDALVKKTTSHETLCPLYPLENKEKLDKFKIDIKNIDRLYYIHSYPEMIKYSYILICRVEYDSSSSSPSYIYVKLYAELQNNDDSDDDDESKLTVTGEILVSTNALLFLDAISSTSFIGRRDYINHDYVVGLTRQSLMEDKILLIEDEASDYRKYYLRSKPFYHTHKNFISFSEKCKDAETICRLIGRALNNQFRLYTKTTPQEMKALVWSREEMNRFNINVEKIDRVYYIRYEENPDGDDFFMLICRVEYNKDKKTSHVYVKLEAECDHQEGFQDIKGCGEILISTKAKYFVDHLYDIQIKIYKEISECIRKSLEKDDGIFIKKRTLTTTTSTTTTTTATDNNNNNNNNPPPSKKLCL